MGKNPAFQFYPSDWSRDLEDHPLEIEGAWIRICCKLWWSETRGELSRTMDQWSRILRVAPTKCATILEYIKAEKIGEISHTLTLPNGHITVICRRMVREEKDRESNRIRQKKHYHKDKPNDPPNEKLTVPSSVLPSLQSSTSKKENIPKSAFGEFGNVLLSGPEREKLIAEYGEKKSSDMVERLSSAMESNPKLAKKYKSHYATIRNWERQGWMESKNGGGRYI